jgi:biopolymer transport protein ExbD
MLVSMIDIFTVLVTFLLMTAVFSHTVVLELKLPPANAQFTEPPPGLQLEVTVRKDSLQVGDRNSGPLASFPNKDGGYDYDGLSRYLQQVKSKFPDKTDATMLLEPDTPYDTVVQTMDRIRVLEVNAGLNVVQYELFPDISIGDAPAVSEHAPMSLSHRAQRMLQHQMRHRADAELNLIPMIDILSVMVSFLLVYSTNVEVLQNTKAIEIPQSIAEQQPRQTVVVMLSKDELFVQGEPIATVAEIHATAGDIIEPLRARSSARPWSARRSPKRTSPTARSRSWATSRCPTTCSRKSCAPVPTPTTAVSRSRCCRKTSRCRPVPWGPRDDRHLVMQEHAHAAH